VILAWPARQASDLSRDIPFYANSVLLELSPKTDPTRKISQIANRPEGDAATVQTVRFESVAIGIYVLTAQAKTESDGGGATVAGAQTEFEVRFDSIARPALTLASTIAKVEILGKPIQLLIGEELALSGHAVDAEGQVILLPENVLTWQQVSGAAISPVTADGQIQGVAKGVARVRLHEPASAHADETDVTVRNYDDGLAVSPWPKLQGNLLNNGRSNSSGVATGVMKWDFVVGDNNDGGISPAVIGTDGTIYFGYRNQLFALDGTTGVQKWRYGTERRFLSTSAPAVGSNGMVYVGTRESFLALDAVTGEKKWEALTGRSLYSPSIGADGTVYAGGTDRLYALDGTTGEKKWEFRTVNEVVTPAQAPDGTLYFASIQDGIVYALDSRTAEKKWEFRAGGAINSSPAIGADGTIYFGAEDRKVYALDGNTGAKKWEFDSRSIVTPAISTDGTVYIGEFTGHLLALDGASGVKKWSYYTAEGGDGVHGTFIFGSPAIAADGTVYVGDFRNIIHALDGVTGVRKWRLASVGAQTSFAIGTEGTIYCSDYTTVYAVG
jgi:outer membrane protein assembly factor BamB